MAVKNKIFYGWFVCSGCLVLLMFTVGLTINLNSIWLPPLKAALNLTGTQTSAIISIQNLTGVIFMIISGKIYYRKSIRVFSFIFGLSISIGYLVFSQADSSYICYLGAVFVGIGYGGGSMIPVSILLTRWFDNKRGLALGIATTGSGIATVVFPAIITYFINNLGLSAAYIISAFIVAVLSFISFVLICDSPEKKALTAYHSSAKEASHTPDYGFTLLQSLKIPRFYFLASALFLLGATVSSTISHIGVHLTVCNYSSLFISTMLSLYGLIMIFSKPLYGFISDKLGGYRANYYIFSIWICALLMATMADSYTAATYLFIILCGIGAPIGTMLPSLIVSDLFGTKDYTQLFTVNKVIFTLGGVVGALIPGIIADLTGEYTIAFRIFWGLTLISFVIVQIMYKTIASQSAA